MAKKSKASSSSSQAGQAAAKPDYVLTIKDSDKVENLDNDVSGGVEMNPQFSFDDAGFAAESETEGWDFGAKPSNGEDDQLDQILKRHGGLKSEASQTEDNSEDLGEDNGDSHSASSDEDADGANGSDEDSSDSDSAEKGSADNGSSEDEGAEKPSESIMSDKSGFFDDGPASSPTATFSAMSLSRPIMKGISKAGYTTPTPIQSAVIPVGLLGKDIVAGAVTGSGKTAAYMIPTLERLVYRPLKTPATRVVVLTPTRELAMQVFDVGQQLGQFVAGLRFGMAIGGLGLRAQEQQLRTKPDIVVATPGRFIDHVRNSPSFSVDQVEVLVVDEADRMLDEGFEAELSEILRLIPAKRQTLLFSATMNSSVQDLVRLSLKKPVRLMINPPKQAAKGLVQEFVRIRKQYEPSKPAVLVSLLRKLGSQRRVIVFVKQKTTAHRLRVITGLMGIKVGELHGSLSQDQRLTSITQFKNLEVPVLICTDLASRGLDIPKIEVVVNYELPLTYEVYLHRIGRSARAGRTGTSISLVGESNAERQVVKSAIKANESSKQKMLGRNVDWDEVKALSAELEAKAGVIDEILAEEKTAKELSVVEKELNRAQNLIEHKAEIQSRPKRTWFDQAGGSAAKRQKSGPQSNHQKKKHDKGEGTQQWAYKKTKGDRQLSAKRGGNRVIMKAGARKAKKMAK